MSRPFDPAPAMSWWHAVNRGVTSRRIFRTRAGCEDFLDLAAEARARFPIEVHAFCLMDSHYHLLIRAGHVELAQALGHIDEGYTHRFRLRHATDEPPFRGRFRTGPIRAERHLVHASRYIHLNPVQAGLVERPEDWPFSSYAAYLDPARAPEWLTTSSILKTFGSIGVRRLYRGFVEEGRVRGAPSDRRALLLFGEEEYRDELRRRAALELPARGAQPPSSGSGDRRVPIATIARVVGEVFEVSVESLRGSEKRGGQDRLARGALVHAAQGFGGHRLSEVAAWMGCGSRAAAARAAIRFARESRQDPAQLRRLAVVRERVRPLGTPTLEPL